MTTEPMLNCSLAIIGGFVLTGLLTPLAMRLGWKFALIDAPDQRRKLHRQPTPTTGGLAVTASFIVMVILFVTRYPGEGVVDLGQLLALCLGALVFALMGILDDYKMLRGRAKFVGQFLILSLAISQGIRIDKVSFLGTDWNLGVLGVPFTLFFLLGAVNSLNLIDGMDGLLGTVGALITLSLGVMALMAGRWLPAFLCLSLAGSLMGFLVYNLPPARVFLGNAGSMVIGYCVGILAIQSSLKGPATVALLAPTALLIIPIMDTAAAIIRRKLTGRSIFSTDRGHFHHCLQRRGWSTFKILAITSLCCLVTGTATLCSVYFQNETFAGISILAVVGILVSGRIFGHSEAMLVYHRGRKFLRSLFQKPGHTHKPHEVEVRLHGDIDWSELWMMLVAGSRDLNVQKISLDVNAPSMAESYHAHWDQHQSGEEFDADWRVEIPLYFSEQVIGRISFTGALDEVPHWEKMQLLGDLLRDFEKPLSMILGESFSAGQIKTQPLPALPLLQEVS